MAWRRPHCGMHASTGLRMVATLSATVMAGTAAAQTAAPDPRTGASVLDAVTVTATRTETSVRDVPGVVTVLDADELARRGVQSIRDVTRYEPGITVGNQPARAGRSSYVIRGIGQNRVLTTIDGVRVPDFPANAQPGTFTRDYVDLESIKRVEIVRGPASSLYGSDAIGGVVAYATKDPADYLAGATRDWFVSGKTAYDSVNNAFAETATLAARAGAFETLLVATRRDFEESQNNGSVPANPQVGHGHNTLGKLVYAIDDRRRVRFTAELFENTIRTNIRTEIGAVTGAPGTSVTDSRGHDVTRRRRAALDYVHSTPIGFVDKLTAIVSYTELDKDDETQQHRSVGASRRLRLTDQKFSQDIVGFDLQLESRGEALGSQHRFVYGLNVDLARTSRLRDRTEINYTAGTVTKTIAGESFPSKVFPDTDTLLGGVYLQDVITWPESRLSIIPGVRVDHYRMTPNPDRAFTINNPQPVADVSASAVSPKLGAVFKASDVYSLFGQYARGFRSPPYDDANIGFRNSTFGYEVLPNANLRPETSDGLEAGLRARFPGGSSFTVSAFYNWYQDFIEQKRVGTSSGGLLQFQSTNIPRVTIWGAEARGEYRLDTRWSLQGAVAFARGTDRSDGTPLDSVDPLRAVAGLRYDHPDDWGLEFVGSGATRKNRVSTPTGFQAPAYAVFDVIGYYDLAPHATLRAGVFNILNKKYWVSQDVVGVAANSGLKDLYSAPGTTFGASLVLKW